MKRFLSEDTADRFLDQLESRWSTAAMAAVPIFGCVWLAAAVIADALTH